MNKNPGSFNGFIVGLGKKVDYIGGGICSHRQLKNFADSQKIGGVSSTTRPPIRSASSSSGAESSSTSSSAPTAGVVTSTTSSSSGTESTTTASHLRVGVIALLRRTIESSRG